MKDYLPRIVQKIGYRSVQDFLKDFKASQTEYSQYRTAIEKWKKETGKEPVAHGIRAKLAEKKQEIQNEQKNKQHTRSQNKDRGARQEDNHGETYYGRKWNQLYFRRGRSVLSRPVHPGRDRVSDWKVWNAERVIFARASEGIISGTGACREVE